MKIDFDNIEDKEGYSPPPQGRYFVESLECEELTGKTSGNDYFKLKLVIIDGDYENSIITDNLYFSSQKSEEHSKFAMKRMGVETEGERDVEAEDLIGFKYQVDAINEKYLDEAGNERTICKVGFYGHHYFNEDEDGNKIEDEGETSSGKSKSDKKSTTKKAAKSEKKTEAEDDIEDLDL